MQVVSLTELPSKKKAVKPPACPTNLTARTTAKYTPAELKIINASNDCINTQIKKLDVSGYKIYPNQKSAAAEIVDNFKDPKVIVQLALGKTQSGKTGLMLSMIQQLIAVTKIPSENIYCITGLSSRVWVSQTQERLPSELCKNVYHRDTLKAFATNITGKSNVLIIIDEVHMACLTDQTIHKVFEEIGLLDLQYLFSHNVRIVDISATPNGVWWNVEKWQDHSKMVFMEPGKGYIGASELLQMGKIKESKSLLGAKPIPVKKMVTKKTAKKPSTTAEAKLDPQTTANITELKTAIDTFKTPRYHIIRTDTGKNQEKVISNLTEVFGKSSKYVIATYDEKSGIADINDILSSPPTTHTIILLKEMLRCAKSLTKKHLGVLYERFAKRTDNAVIIQGLLGRLTGYDYNGDAICFTHPESIELYETCWKTKFADIKKWTSGSTLSKKGVVRARPTFSSPELVTGLATEEPIKPKQSVSFKVFDTHAECATFVKSLGWKTVAKKKKNTSGETGGFYTYMVQKAKHIYTVAEAKSAAKSALVSAKKTKDKYSYTIGYLDTADSASEKHILAYIQ
jgi:hypothetical protein